MTYDEYLARETEKTKPKYGEQLALLYGARDKEVAALENQKKAYLNDLTLSKDKAQQQAYIQREMSKRDLPQYLGKLGINGGMSESAALDINRGYKQSLGAAGSEYGQNATKYNTQHDTNVSGLRSNYDKQALDLYNQNQTQAQQSAQYSYQMALQQQQAEEQKRQWQAQFDAQQAQFDAQQAQAQQMAAQQMAQQMAAQQAAKAGGGGSSNSGGKTYKKAMSVSGGTSSYDPYVIRWSDGSSTTSKKYIKAGSKVIA